MVVHHSMKREILASVLYCHFDKKRQCFSIPKKKECSNQECPSEEGEQWDQLISANFFHSQI